MLSKMSRSGRTDFPLKSENTHPPMVWKLLSVIAALCLGAAVWFANLSKNDIKFEKEAKDNAIKNLAQVNERKEEANKSLETKRTQVATLTKELEKVKDDVVKAVAEVQEKSTALELAKKNLEQTAQQLTTMETKIKEAGDIEKLLAQVAALKKEREAAESKVTAETQAVAAAQEKLGGLQKQIETSREAEARARKGELEPTFTARIAQPFANWGFAVLSKGNSAGVVANADLLVKRNDAVVAKLRVRNVEQTISIADIIPGSLAEGDTLRSGDLVVAAPVVKKEPPPPAAPTKGGTAPAAPAPAAPAAADPFAAAPAPAAAPMAADPFAAPAAPAAPAAADPFATPPPAAPAAGGAPATGAGTKASPLTNDPFAK